MSHLLRTSIFRLGARGLRAASIALGSTKRLAVPQRATAVSPIRLAVPRAVLLIVCTHLGACEGAPAGTREPEPLSESTRELTSVDRQDFDRAFDAAVCSCEVMLGVQVTSPNTIAWADAALTAYDARNRTAEGRTESACSNSARGSAPLRNQAQALGSACYAPTDPRDLRSGSVQEGVVTPGFCRADFDYCIAQELAASARSIARPIGSAALKRQVLAAARGRMEAAVLEFEGTLGLFGRWCSDPTIGVSNAWACSRFTHGEKAGGDHVPWARVAPGRIRDGIEFIRDTAAHEVALAREAVDSEPLPGGGVTVASYLYNAWGYSQPRVQAATMLYGRSGSGPFVHYDTRRTAAGYASSSIVYELQKPRTVAVGPLVEQAMRLLETYQMPSGIVRNAAGQNEPDDLRGSYFSGQTAGWLYRLLDHRLAAIRRIEPYATATSSGAALGDVLRSFDPLTETQLIDLANPSNAIPAATSPLLNEYGIHPQHVELAAELVAELLTATDARYTSEVSANLSGGRQFRTAKVQSTSGAWAHAGINAMARVSPSADLYSDPLEHGIDGLILPFSSGSDMTHAVLTWLEELHQMYDVSLETNFYSLSAFDPFGSSTDFETSTSLRLREVGTAGALQNIRVHLLRLISEHAAGRIPTQVDKSDLEAANDAADRAIGSTWTELNAYTDDTCDNPAFDAYDFTDSPLYRINRYEAAATGVPAEAPESCATHRRTSLGSQRTWSHYSPLASDGSDPYQDGEFRITRDLDVVRCAVHGQVDGHTASEPALPPTGECWGAATLVTDVTTTTPAELGARYVRRRATLNFSGVPAPNGTASADATVFVLFVKKDQANLAHATRVEIVDAFNPTQVTAVHAFGGELREHWSALFDRSPRNPTRTLSTTFGVPEDVVPPLDVESIAGTTPTNAATTADSSWQRRLLRAEQLATQASQAFEDARDNELEAVRNARSDAASLALVAADGEAQLRLLCGEATSDACHATRSPPVRFYSTTASESLGISGAPSTPPVLDFGGEPWVYADCTEFLRAFPGDYDPEHATQAHDDMLRAAVDCLDHESDRIARDTLIGGLPQRIVDEFRARGLGEFRDLGGQMKSMSIVVYEDLVNARVTYGSLAQRAT